MIIWFLFANAEMFYERGSSHEFVSLSKELAAAGEITGVNEFPFEFSKVEKQHESYHGINVRLRCESPSNLSPLFSSLRASFAVHFVFLVFFFYVAYCARADADTLMGRSVGTSYALQ